MRIDTPVVLLIYNRPELTARVLAEIARARPRKLLVVADGPQADRPGDDRRVAETRAVIAGVDWPCEVITNYSPVNLGLKRRVSSGLDWVFDQVEQAIVLEDDCVPDPSFFAFCTQLLNRYRDDERVLSIGGINFQEHVMPAPYSYYFSKYFRCWGWASWRRAWRHFDASMQDWPAWKSGGLKSIADSGQEQRYWRKTLDAVHVGRIESWAFAFSFASFRCGGLHVQPSVNLVSNIGFDDDATHTRNAGHRFANCAVKSIDTIRHPPEVVRDEAADRYTFTDVYHQDRPPRWKRLLASVNKRLKRVAQCGKLASRYRRRLRLRRMISRVAEKRIIVGACGTQMPGWISTDVKELNLLDPRDWQFQFNDASVDAVLAEHVWEHLTIEQGFAAACTCFRFLKPGGYLRVAVPDGLHPDASYIDWVRPNGNGAGADDHKVLYTRTTLRNQFERAGFEVRLLEYFDEQGRFHRQPWDPQDGMIHRSLRFDKRNADGRPNYTSLIVDAIKPPAVHNHARAA